MIAALNRVLLCVMFNPPGRCVAAYCRRAHQQRNPGCQNLVSLA